jgi:hypothetical protein
MIWATSCGRAALYRGAIMAQYGKRYQLTRVENGQVDKDGKMFIAVQVTSALIHRFAR